MQNRQLSGEGRGSGGPGVRDSGGAENAPRPAGMIGTLFAFPIERGYITAMQNSAEHGPQPMLCGILLNHP